MKSMNKLRKNYCVIFFIIIKHSSNDVSTCIYMTLYCTIVGEVGLIGLPWFSTVQFLFSSLKQKYLSSRYQMKMTIRLNFNTQMVTVSLLTKTVLRYWLASYRQLTLILAKILKLFIPLIRRLPQISKFYLG